ncbi:MAG TPA: glycosyltransferase family A protein [Gaiellaceae bacterium]|nr:glycosyltransferase family A protein [Gaiellaceae bacterium]
MTRVAVVIPCFDDGATLPAALASLEDQEDHELLIVDDGSTDAGTIAYLAQLERAGTRVVHQENEGLSAARMAGVAATSSPYVFPLDADDELVPGAIAELADVLDATPSLAAAWGDVELFGARNLVYRLPGRLDPWLLTYLNEIPGTCLYRRSALEAVGGWRLRGGYEDWDLWLSFAERGFEGVRVAEVVLRYRQHSGRMNAHSIAEHAQKHAHLRELHPSLFGDRARLRSRSPEPRRVKALFPVLEAVPGLSLWRRHSLCRLVRDPRTQFAARRQ